MVTNKQLDAVFFYIKTKTKLGVQINYNYIWNLYINKTPELNIDSMLLHDILQKLINDGYLFQSTDKMYHLSVEGRNFQGYFKDSRWYNRLFTMGVKDGIIYSLIVALILWAITKGYNMIFSK